MAIQSQPKDIPVYIDPYSFMADIQVLSGNPVQNYNKDTNTYEPDRVLIPCVLMPYVSVSDPEGVMGGIRDITGAEWYEGAPKPDGSNRIVNGTDYQVSAAGKPQYSLTVKKNIDYNSPVEIHCILSFTDTRRNKQVNVERSIVLRTTIFDSKNYSLKMDKPASYTINPLAVTPDAEGKWIEEITAQLYSGSTPVPDANAAYWWEVLDKGVWREFNETELAFCVDGKNGGIWGKKLTIDARFMRHESFRCRAAYYNGVRPASPSDDSLQCVTSIKVEMPKTLGVAIVQSKGFKVSATLATPVSFTCYIPYNKGYVGVEKDHLFAITWFVRSLKPGNQPIQAGSGRNCDFVPSSFGFDPNYPMQVYAEVKLYAETAAVMSGDSYVYSGDNLIVQPLYE